MLHKETVEASTLELLRELQERFKRIDTRLVGGTALALQLAHRKSVDLDLFTQVPFAGDELACELDKIEKRILEMSDSPEKIFKNPPLAKA